MKKTQILIISIILLTIFSMPLFNALTGAILNGRMILRGNLDESIDKYIVVKNVNNIPVNIEISTSGELGEDINIQDKKFLLNPKEQKEVHFTVLVKEQRTKEGKINVRFISADNSNDSVSLSSTIILIGEIKPPVQIISELDPKTPEAIAGNQVIINSNITNLGNKETAYSISIHENRGWSRLVSINPKNIKLKPGESKLVTIILNIDKNAYGDEEFIIKLTDKNRKSIEQRIALAVIKPLIKAPKITAELSPKNPVIIPGKTIDIIVNIKNIGESKEKYLINIYSHFDWAKLISINPKIIILKPQESKNFNIKLRIAKDTTGEKEFTILANYSYGYSAQKTIALAIEN